MLGLLCHPGDSGVVGSKLRASSMLGFLAVLVLLVPCTNRFLGPFRIFWRSQSRRALVITSYVYIDASFVPELIALVSVPNKVQPPHTHGLGPQGASNNFMRIF